MDIKNNNVLSEIKKIMKITFPDNKIPILVSPVSNSNNTEYITWDQYSSTGPYSQINDNYCRPNNAGEYQYPSNEELKDCNDIINSDVLELMDLNNFIMNIEKNSAQENELAIELDQFDNSINSELEKYKSLKSKYETHKKINNNMKNIIHIIKELNKQKNQNDAEIDNLVNINNQSVSHEEYDFLNKQLYIYVIIGLCIILSILFITKFYY